jgi:hypothetical protein
MAARARLCRCRCQRVDPARPVIHSSALHHAPERPPPSSLQVGFRRAEIAALNVGDLHQNRGFDALRVLRKGIISLQ